LTKKKTRVAVFRILSQQGFSTVQI